MANAMQGVYSPLPQNLSDSDSEKDITMEPVCGTYGNKGPKNDHFERHAFKQNGNMNFHGMSVDVLKVKRINPKMSTLRKTAFVCSILLCFLPVVIFLWVLPCSDSETCPIKILNWEYEQRDIELKGRVNIVHGLFKTNLNLAVMYEGSKFSNDHRNGVISFLGTNGAVAWDFHQEPTPISMDCSIINVDGNGLKDCLILDDKGLKAIETISGTIIWHVHSHEPNIAINDLGNPVKLTDFNHDGISEFLCVYQSNSFLIICGKTGKALRNIKINCNNTIDVGYSSKTEKLSYGCKNEQIVKFFEIPLKSLKQKYLDATYNVKPHKTFGNKMEQIYVTGNRKLIVNKIGDCPACQAEVSLHDEAGKRLRAWNYKAYVMRPETFSFQTTDANVASLKGHTNGFILKLWEWPEKKTELKRAKRSIPFSNDTSYMYKITERVLFITFNTTNIHVINASMSEINQICTKNSVDKVVCQPDHTNQEESLLIADLDQDNSQEMISHSSTFIRKEEDDGDEWQLMSYLKVFRLEGELPKLYKEN